MTLLVKDANTTVQSLSTEVDGSGNLVPVHAPAATDAQGVSSPVGPQNPLPVVNTAGSAASDGSGTVATGGSAQTLFGGIVPANGFLVQNNSTAALWISDVGTAAASGASIQLAANGGIFATPSGYKPAGAVSLFGATNEVATDESLAALYDRFLVRVRTDNVDEIYFPDLLDQGWRLESLRFQGLEEQIAPALSITTSPSPTSSTDRSTVRVSL